MLYVNYVGQVIPFARLIIVVWQGLGDSGRRGGSLLSKLRVCIVGIIPRWDVVVYENCANVGVECGSIGCRDKSVLLLTTRTPIIGSIVMAIVTREKLLFISYISRVRCVQYNVVRTWLGSFYCSGKSVVELRLGYYYLLSRKSLKIHIIPIACHQL